MEWLGENLWAAWLGAAMVLGLAELASLDLVLLMLAVGALAGMVTAIAIPDAFAIQALAALATSVAMLVFVRPSIVKRLHSGPDLRAGIDALVGKEGFALSNISVHGGTIKLGGEVWTAKPYDDSEVIQDGAKVQVIEIKGATAYVHEVPQLGA